MVSCFAVEEASSLASLVTSTDDPAAKDCKNYRAVAQNFDVRFLGPERSVAVGPVTVAYRRFGPLELLAPLTGMQRPLVRSALLNNVCCLRNGIFHVFRKPHFLRLVSQASTRKKVE